MTLNGTNQQQNKICGYWKFNNNLLNDSVFCETVTTLIMNTFSDGSCNPMQTWEYFKYQVRDLAIKRR